jgi:hypothetical protein
MYEPAQGESPRERVRRATFPARQAGVARALRYEGAVPTTS